jgi:hypothetical protein
MQPGNNYRVVASVVDQSLITGVQVTTSTAGKYLGHSAVYVEGCREAYNGVITGISGERVRLQLNKWIVATACHEMGHQPGIQTPNVDHSEAKIMSDGMIEVNPLMPENSIFSTKTIRRFRTSNRWSE